MMRVAFDSSVLVAAVLAEHPSHQSAEHWINACLESGVEGTVSAHALAEVYSVLTKIPGGPTAADANVVVARLTSILRVSAIATDVYLEAIALCAHRGFRSGSVFDALHWVQALRDGSDVLLTFNLKDFVRFGPHEKLKVVAPQDPPSIAL